MANIDQQIASGAPAPAHATVDLGLRAFMLQVYNYMAASLLLTAVVAYGTFLLAVTTDPSAAVAGQPPAPGGLYLTSFGAMLFGGPMFIAVVCAPLVAIVLLYVTMAFSRSTAMALAMFFLVSFLFGLGLSVIFVVYTAASIVKVFLIASATFGAVSLYGYTTKRDLTSMGTFLFMGLAGLVIASFVNLIFQSSVLDFGLSVIGVLIFTGLTAYDTQKAKEQYSPNDAPDALTRKAITSALQLYLDFINIFLHLLKLLGKLRGSNS